MHVVHPPTPEPNMLCFWHMEQGKEKGKTVFYDKTLLVYSKGMVIKGYQN